jgi:hypothetical protein
MRLVLLQQEKRKKPPPSQTPGGVPNGKAVVEEEPEEHGDASLVRTGRFVYQSNIIGAYFQQNILPFVNETNQPSDVLVIHGLDTEILYKKA